MMSIAGFHEGELSVQHRAGVSHEAARLEGMLGPAHLDGGAARFLARRELALLTGRDRDGLLWTSPLVGPPGFLDAHGRTLSVHVAPPAGDPLHGLPSGGPVAVLAIDLAIRRRLRVNGTLTAAGDDGLEIAADQVFGNCPSYIRQRHLEPGPARTTVSPPTVAERGTLDRALIERADTFFLGTAHPTRGADTSHRGGPPGFVRADGPDLWWPDYPGNNMFNSLGNLTADAVAALLFVDFTTGTTLHLSGTAAVEWTTPGVPGDDGGTGRRVRFHPAHTVTTSAFPLRAPDGPWPYGSTLG
jgi:predicted pyridoxine 5'-phosphate oxidase superfamily flavin-nucleotide-binding protein